MVPPRTSGPIGSCTQHCSHISDFNICSGCITSSRDNGGRVIPQDLGRCLTGKFGTKEQGDGLLSVEMWTCREKLRNADVEERKRYITCFRDGKIEDCVYSVSLTIKCEKETSLGKNKCKDKCESQP